MRYTVLKLPQELGTRLKIEAALRGVHMNRLACEFIEEALSVRPPTRQNGPPKATRAVALVPVAPKRQRKK